MAQALNTPASMKSPKLIAAVWKPAATRPPNMDWRAAAGSV
jgi:hypothetical protein